MPVVRRISVSVETKFSPNYNAFSTSQHMTLDILDGEDAFEIGHQVALRLRDNVRKLFSDKVPTKDLFSDEAISTDISFIVDDSILEGVLAEELDQ